MKINVNLLLKSIAIVVVLLALVGLGQIWFNIFSPEILWKVVASLVIIGGLVSVLIAILMDIDENKKMKDDNYLN
jgi:protein-S-isoprenylcysteine O-methyltransferase Ste14